MIYLDHAATSYPKPATVAAAVQHWYQDVGVSADRGEGPRTREAVSVVQRVRKGIAKMTGHTAERVACNSGATEGLNLVLRALLAPGSRVLTTPFEHSSVVRPLLALRDERNLQLDVPTEGATDGPTHDALAAAIAATRPKVVVFSHASNVTGAIFDAERICQVAREHGTISVLDASQTAGYLSLDVGADVVIGSGHKAMHGPPAIGFVSVHSDLEMAPQKHGGTGSSAALDRHPTQWPQAFEAGTPNTPAIFGLAAAMDWLAEEGEGNLLQRALQRLNEVETGLQRLNGFRTIATGSQSRTPVLSFVHPNYDPLEIGSVLAANEIHARAGFHCAPWIHQHIGTATAGTVRIATGPNTSASDVEALLAVLATL
ncbi:MAG: cysteine desulfurase/selenocysteine lyase [Planctomycetota bacterium]|jgi:cysteine desulfurase/selenocysteine lyase